LSSHVPRPEPFKANIRVVDLESTLATPSASNYKLTQEGPLAMLEFKGTRYQFPAPVELTIRAMSTHATFRASDLPDHLDSDGRLALIRHLHDIGFLSRSKGRAVIKRSLPRRSASAAALRKSAAHSLQWPRLLLAAAARHEIVTCQTKSRILGRQSDMPE
jgi:hypothetical protein